MSTVLAILAADSDRLIATHRPEQVIPDDAYEDARRIILPVAALAKKDQGGVMVDALADDWRQHLSVSIDREAQRRSELVLPADERATAFAAIQDATIEHGATVADWPDDVQQVRADYLAKLELTKAIKAKAEMLKTDPPFDITADEAWA